MRRCGPGAALQPTVDGMAKEGVPFQGVLFAGLMIQNGKPRLLEYNVQMIPKVVLNFTDGYPSGS